MEDAALKVIGNPNDSPDELFDIENGSASPHVITLWRSSGKTCFIAAVFPHTPYIPQCNFYSMNDHPSRAKVDHGPDTADNGASTAFRLRRIGIFASLLQIAGYSGKGE